MSATGKAITRCEFKDIPTGRTVPKGTEALIISERQDFPGLLCLKWNDIVFWADYGEYFPAPEQYARGGFFEQYGRAPVAGEDFDPERMTQDENEMLTSTGRYSVQTVTIPACDEHQGYRSMTVRIGWACPLCGEKRGKIRKVLSFDGSLRLTVDGWDNPCGHVDKYSMLREEARLNGLNQPAPMIEHPKAQSKVIHIEGQFAFEGVRSLEDVLCLATLHTREGLTTYGEARAWWVKHGEDCAYCPHKECCLACFINQ